MHRTGFPHLFLIAALTAVLSVAAQQTSSGAPPEMGRLAALAGEWEVDFESRAEPDQPFTKLHTRSSITALLAGAFLQERLSMPQPKGRPIELIGLWGYDRFRCRYRFAWLDDTFALFDVHEGNWEGDALIVNNLRSGTTLRFGEQEVWGRMIWREIAPDGFAVESQVSFDGGRNWFTQARGRYTRSR